MPIESFDNKDLEELFVDGFSRRIDKRLHKKLLYILDVLDSAESISDAASLPKFHVLKGGRYAVSVTGNWRVTFRLENRRTIDVDFLDYH